ncbi:MAG: arginine--tRNA ligase [Actinobacteria bacterium]|nr:arginine--tRNA ligase [Actinomycetota bacterium]MBM3712076.1 arginine--tRNA ligase [Actinomycetota bacterium]
MIINNLKQKLNKDVAELIGLLEKQGLILKENLEKLNISNITIGPPKNKTFGDLSTNAAMVLAPALQESPIKTAEMLEEKVFFKWNEIQSISIVPPGFINLSLSQDFIVEKLLEISSRNEGFGFNDSGKNIKIQIEFVSANPTGSLHIGHGRWAALGDALSNIYNANGFNVWREYYVNDYGSQVNKFALCIRSLYLNHFGKVIAYPDDGYPKEIAETIAAEIIDRYGDKFLIRVQPDKKDENLNKFKKNLEEKSIKTNKSSVKTNQSNQSFDLDADLDALAKKGIKIMLDRIKNTLKSMNVSFDEWFYESSLYKKTHLEDTVEKLKNRGLIYHKDEALWFKSFEFGDDKDRVVIRTGGEPTYFASDIMYLLNKIGRGFDRLIYILGADHHGYIKRLHAVGKAVGYDDEKINVIIGQLVRLVKKGKAVRMSKRDGTFYNLDDLIMEVGKDAVRYFFTTSSFDTPLDFDIELAKQKSNKNPVYYVQYAHARIVSVIEKIKELFSKRQLSVNEKDLDLSSVMENLKKAKIAGGKKFNDVFNGIISKINFKNLNLENAEEFELAKILMLYPDIIYDACINNAPYLINQFLYRLASQFHYFYNHYRIIDEGKLNKDRFKLILLVRIVLANAMKILSINAPLKM